MEKAISLEQKAPPQGKISFEEFLAWADEDTRAEWEDGQIIVMSPASLEHQELSGWLSTILRVYTRRRNLGQILTAPFLVRLQIPQQGREPDLIFIKTEHLDRLQHSYLLGPPDLVVEIVSTESIGRDRGRKFVEYEADGIPEYWLLDPLRQEAEFYQLGSDNHYHLSLPDPTGVYHSLSVSGFWLKVSWLWHKPLPDELDILQELGITKIV